MDRADGWGHAEGREVLEKLLAFTQARPGTAFFCVSLDGVERTDASFPRESVIELARQLRGRSNICLCNVNDQDLLDNWDAAAVKKEQPVIAWTNGGSRLLGPQPSEGLHQLFSLIEKGEGITTSEAAAALGLNIPNVSNKLKALSDQGYVLRLERTAVSGGKEYEYYVAR